MSVCDVMIVDTASKNNHDVELSAKWHKNGMVARYLLVNYCLCINGTKIFYNSDPPVLLCIR